MVVKKTLSLGGPTLKKSITQFKFNTSIYHCNTIKTYSRNPNIRLVKYANGKSVSDQGSTLVSLTKKMKQFKMLKTPRKL